MIKVYTKVGCPPCDATKRKMKKEGIDFEEVSLMDNPEAIDYIKSLGYMQAPVVVTETESWGDFRPDRILALKKAA